MKTILYHQWVKLNVAMVTPAWQDASKVPLLSSESCL